jgi:predicted nucleotide-binding protein
MDKRTLLPKQLKEVRQVIRDAGFDDSEFHIEELESKAMRSFIVSVLFHKPTNSYFYFDSGLTSTDWWYIRSPGQDSFEDSDQAGSWENQIEEVRKWLRSVKEQIENADPWATSSHVMEAKVSAKEVPVRVQASQSSISEKKIFIGHGRSNMWKDLKDFLQDRLQLSWDEFNREPQAGRTAKERLEEMLEHACFAFLIMTAEDEHADQKFHARENVVHEVGLFQGRLGFNKAIILLEDGCEPFSNVHGLTQIRFPKGHIMTVSEEVRRVLEREGIL